jgi:hypothetical protein
MSRPTINRPESSNIEIIDVFPLRSTSLRPAYKYINETPLFNKLLNAVKLNRNNYKPSNDIKPILTADRKQINTCMSIMSEYLNCREINPEYKCEEIREFLLRIKCI